MLGSIVQAVIVRQGQSLLLGRGCWAQRGCSGVILWVLYMCRWVFLVWLFMRVCDTRTYTSESVI